MNTLQQYILATLAYFDIFKYPLSNAEIRSFLKKEVSQNAIDEELKTMIAAQKLFRFDSFYSLHNDSNLAERRRKGNALAAVEMHNAIKAARRLAGFPYVSGLAISGSLSKNFCTEKTDIDFFVITRANRLWIARSIMHLYKKLTFLLGKQHWFCMNYYIDEAKPEIEEKNIFTAVEISTLLPMHGKAVLCDFIQHNQWIKDYLPAHRTIMNNVPEIKKRMLARLAEQLFNNRFGNWIDDRLMRVTQKRWQKKEQKKLTSDKGFLMSMMVDKHYSKPNPKNFQQQVLESYEKKVSGLLHHEDHITVLPDFVA